MSSIAFGFIVLVLVGFVFLIGYASGHDDGHAQGLLDARCEREADEHENGLPQ